MTFKQVLDKTLSQLLNFLIERTTQEI